MLNGLAVWSVFYQLVEILHYLVTFAQPWYLCGFVYVRLKLSTGRKADCARHFDLLYFAVKINSEKAVDGEYTFWIE